MTLALSAIADLDAALAEVGETITIARTATDAEGAVTTISSVTCAAMVRAVQPQDLLGDGAHDSAVIVSPTGLGAYGVPQKDDRITIQGSTGNIETIAPVYIGGDLVRVKLACRT